MRRLTILLLITSCLFPGVATASEYPVLDNQVETRQTHLEWLLTLQEISMEAVVDYIDEISDGNGTSDLEDILAEFRGEVDDIESYITHLGLNNFLRGLRDLTTSFREETRSRMNEYDGKVLVLLVRIGEKIAENQGQLDTLKDHYWDNMKENSLENFDIRVERAQGVLDTLDERGYDISEAQGKLDEIAALRDDLEAALDDRDSLEILSVSLQALDLSRELAEIVRALQVEVPPSRVLGHWVNIGEKVVERTGVIINELKRLEMDTGELEEIHGEAEIHVAEAKAKLEDGEIVGAVGALMEFKEDLIELRDAYVDLVFPEGVPEALQEAMDALWEKLQETAQDMEESLETL